jgi:protein-tyrosine phosphatase
MTPFNWNWIEEYEIVAGTIPKTPDDMIQLMDLGVRSVLSLTRRNPATYPDMAVPFGLVEHLHSPWPDCGLPDEQKMAFALGWMTGTKHADKWPIYVHCRGGVGRTGLMLMAYYVLIEDKSLDEAREILRTRRVCPYTGNTGDSQGEPQHTWKLSIPTFWER